MPSIVPTSFTTQLTIVRQLARYLKEHAAGISYAFVGTPTGAQVAAALDAVLVRCDEFEHGGWIAVDSLLPELNRDVLIFDGAHISIGRRCDGRAWSTDDARVGTEVRNVSHWRVLPNVPQPREIVAA